MSQPFIRVQTNEQVCAIFAKTKTKIAGYKFLHVRLMHPQRKYYKKQCKHTFAVKKWKAHGSVSDCFISKVTVYICPPDCVDKGPCNVNKLSRNGIIFFSDPNDAFKFMGFCFLQWGDILNIMADSDFYFAFVILIVAPSEQTCLFPLAVYFKKSLGN